MQITRHGKKPPMSRRNRRKFMALLCLLLLAYKGFPQNLNLSLTNASLENAFREIEKQSSYRFTYTSEMLEGTLPVTLTVKQMPVKQVVARLLLEQPIDYIIEDHVVILSPKIQVPASLTDISGTVFNEKGEGIPGVTVMVKGGSKATSTDNEGRFRLEGVEARTILVLSSIGYETKELRVTASPVTIVLSFAIGKLDETVVIAYGTTTNRLNTGNVVKLSAEEIGKQPVANPLAALGGRVPGLIVTQRNGVPGGSFKVQLRGQSSIGSSPGTLPLNDPLFIIDGVPFAPNNTVVSQLPSAIGNGSNGSGISPLNSINPADIESMEVLKDADATAIYGSRGAHGVILITTKKGKAGKTNASFNLYTGVGKALPTMELMNTKQYVTLRKEALVNDGLVPTAANAPDLLLLDTTRYTDWKKVFIGGAAKITNAQASLSGGTAATQFLLGTGYHHETTVFPGDYAYNRFSAHLSLNHNSPDQKFKSTLSALFSTDRNNMAAADFAGATRLVPNAPPLYDANGKLSWQENGVTFNNPFSYLHQRYNALTDNLLTNLQLSYRLLKTITLKTNLGYNAFTTSETGQIPIASQNPAYNPQGYAFYGATSYKSWIIEPQAEASLPINKKGKLKLLLGSSWQENTTNSTNQFGSGYTSDALLGSMNAAGSFSGSNNRTEYHYVGIFGRANFNWDDRYILNFSARRDGSSRFGPASRFGSFGALGAAWIFSKTSWIKQHLGFLSFGKLRASYGLTGNDQIPDYGYLDLWNPLNVASPYQGIPGISPNSLFNDNFGWEENKKLEASLDIAVVQNRFLLSATFFQNRSSNLLIVYRLPSQTGFPFLSNKNFPALVENKGWEFSLNMKNVSTENFSWTSNLSLTIPKNKLLSFPGLANSSYALTLVEGEPLSVIRGFEYTGVDPQTGLFSVRDRNGDGLYNTNDYIVTGNRETKFFGGFSNSLSYKGFELSSFFEGRKQNGVDYMRFVYSSFAAPGKLDFDLWSNQPLAVLDRWQKPGDQALFERYFSSSSSAANAAVSKYLNSNATNRDISFIRLKTLSLAYRISPALLTKLGLAGVRLYVQGQNLLTITSYKGGDPETQSPFSLPPLRVITAGLQVNL